MVPLFNILPVEGRGTAPRSGVVEGCPAPSVSFGLVTSPSVFAGHLPSRGGCQK
jgi:hypothetical protein